MGAFSSKREDEDNPYTVTRGNQFGERTKRQHFNVKPTRQHIHVDEDNPYTWSPPPPPYAADLRIACLGPSRVGKTEWVTRYVLGDGTVTKDHVYKSTTLREVKEEVFTVQTKDENKASFYVQLVDHGGSLAAKSKWFSVYNVAENMLYFIDACSDESVIQEEKKLLHEAYNSGYQNRMPLLIVGLNGHLPNARSAEVLSKAFFGFPAMVLDPTLPVPSRVSGKSGPKFNFEELNTTSFDKVDVSMPLQWLAVNGKFVKKNC